MTMYRRGESFIHAADKTSRVPVRRVNGRPRARARAPRRLVPILPLAILVPSAAFLPHEDGPGVNTGVFHVCAHASGQKPRQKREHRELFQRVGNRGRGKCTRP